MGDDDLDDGREGGYDQRKCDNELRSFVKGKPMTTIRTRDDMASEFGTPPPANDGEMRWTIHRGGRVVRYKSSDRGLTWEHFATTWPEEQARREMQAHDQHEIQRTLK